jgi:type II secretory pathway pseudopilin PulG
VALSILAIVAAIIVPSLLNVQSQSYTATAGQIASQLNTLYAEWQSDGGVAGSSVACSDILYVLTGASNTNLSATRGNTNSISDGGASNSIRTGLPGPLPTDFPSLTPTASYNPMSIVHAGNFFITFANGTFNAMPTDNLSYSSSASTMAGAGENTGEPLPGRGNYQIMTFTNGAGGSGEIFVLPMGNEMYTTTQPAGVTTTAEYMGSNGQYTSLGVQVPIDGTSGTLYGVDASGNPIKIVYGPDSAGNPSWQVFSLQQ